MSVLVEAAAGVVQGAVVGAQASVGAATGAVGASVAGLVAALSRSARGHDRRDLYKAGAPAPNDDDARAASEANGDATARRGRQRRR